MMRLTLILAFFFILGTVSAQNNEVKKIKNEGIVFYKNKNYNEAIKSFKKALELAPEDIDITYKLGLSANKAKNYDLAIDCFTKTLEAGKSPQKSYFYLASAYKGKDDYTKTQEILEKGLKQYPNDKNIKKLGVSVYLKLGLDKYNEGVELQKKLAPMAKTDAEKYKVEIEKAKVIFTEALATTKKSYDISPKKKKVLKALVGICKALENKTEEAKYKKELDALKG